MKLAFEPEIAVAREKRLRARKRPRQARSEQTVDAILEAAARILARNGYARATTNDVAEKAGISIGSLYQYFPSKDAILVALVARHMREVTELMLAELAKPGESVSAVLERAARNLVAFHERDPKLHRILVEEVPHPAELRGELDELEERLSEEVARLLESHGARNVPVASWLVVHALETLTHHWVLHAPRGVSVETFSKELASMLAAFTR